MVAYLKNNFFLVLTIVVLPFVVSSSYGNFSTMVTKDEINIICTKEYVNSSLCFELLKSIPKISALDFNGLTKFLIKYQSRNVSDALNQIKMYAGNATDLQTIDLCVRLYENTLYDTDHILKALATKKYFIVNIYITGLDANMGICREELVVMKPRLEVLITRNKVITNLSSIILCILECYLAKEKAYC
ncbi:hypothetical protein BRARA_H01112 [Brassica rapa]|uniref:Pectinesterase inhibitor domain-containing protein n=1 Tax=Brassica campestris TaxID=3711 RepID=A0A397YBX8_BRACM|nr:uncharacterized protein LOC103834249 [Brassica rapa]RID50378.1 hypothetical protein BRARA_H01112 [Brassica rapa]